MTAGTNVATIGESIVIKGELSADEDLVIDGQVEGKINLNQNALTVGEHGKVNAKIVAKTVVVAGEVRGNITAAEAVDIRNTSSFEGDVWAPRVAIAFGANIRGGIDTQQSQSGGPCATSAAYSGVDVPDKSRGKDAPKPVSVTASGAPGLKSWLRPPNVPGATAGGRPRVAAER